MSHFLPLDDVKARRLDANGSIRDLSRSCRWLLNCDLSTSRFKRINNLFGVLCWLVLFGNSFCFFTCFHAAELSLFSLNQLANFLVKFLKFLDVIGIIFFISLSIIVFNRRLYRQKVRRP